MQRLVQRFARPQLQRNASRSVGRSSRLMASRRCFATDNNNQERPVPFNEGLMGRWQFVTRVWDRLDKLETYQQANVFHPRSSEVFQNLLFWRLNLPTNTEIDVLEFLKGTRYACQSVMSKMLSKEFMEFCLATANHSNPGNSPNEAITVSDKSRQVAQELKRCLSPLVYKRLVKHTQKTTAEYQTFARGNDVELKDAHLVNVKWNRMQRSEYERKLHQDLDEADLLPSNDVFDAAQFDDEEFVEVLQLTVHVSCRIKLQIDEFLQNGTAVGNWCFESIVTNPDDLDWVVVSYSTRVVTKNDAVLKSDNSIKSTSEASNLDDTERSNDNDIDKQSIAPEAPKHQQRESNRQQRIPEVLDGEQQDGVQSKKERDMK